MSIPVPSSTVSDGFAFLFVISMVRGQLRVLREGMVPEHKMRAAQALPSSDVRHSSTEGLH